MKLFYIFLIIEISLCLASNRQPKQKIKHVCDHDKYVYEPNEADDSNLFKGRILQATPWNPIRLYFDYAYITNNASVPSATAALLQNIFFPQVQSFFQSGLNVKTYPGNITVPTGSACLNVTIPKMYITGGPGVNADLVILVFAYSQPSSPVTASASACVLSSTTGRPILGQIYINLASFDAENNEYQTNVVKHELTHVLAFSPPLFSRYIYPNGTTIPKASVVQSVVSRGDPTQIIITPSVVAWTRQYFNCSTLQGMELENQGAAGSIGTHWETRLVADEVMVASVPYQAFYSNFTAALLNDSGWYQVNPSMVSSTSWGNSRGCGFVNNLCILNGQPAYPEFCTPNLVKATTGCTLDGRYKASCFVSTGISLLSSWQYFAGIVSKDQFADNCPYMMSYSNGDCTNPSENWNIPVFQEYYGLYGACFTGNMVLKAYVRYTGLPNFGCFEMHCLIDNTLTYYLNVTLGGISIPCPSEGGPVSVNSYNTNYRGNLNCPPASTYCAKYSPCPNMCNNNGLCIDGVCQCTNGATTTDCH